jgi:hypothetical protein
MESPNTQELLQQLHDEINRLETVDEKGTELLRDLDGDIRALLERSEEGFTQVHPSVFTQLEGTIRHFEVSHPDLTDLIAKVSISLSNAGV